MYVHTCRKRIANSNSMYSKKSYNYKYWSIYAAHSCMHACTLASSQLYVHVCVHARVFIISHANIHACACT